MKIRINIGLANFPNMTNVEFNKKFENITFAEIKEKVLEKHPQGARVIGWCPSNGKLRK